VRSLGSQTKNRISSIKNIGWYDRISNILGNHTNRISSIKKKTYFTIFQAGFIGCSPYFKLVSNRILFGNWIYHRQFMKQLGCVWNVANTPPLKAIVWRNIVIHCKSIRFGDVPLKFWTEHVFWCSGLI
jgi:hypothetical protein